MKVIQSPFQTIKCVPIKMWDPNLDEGALEQAMNLSVLPFIFRWIAVMADGHKGTGMPIGGVIATKGVIIPNAVGVDIGCGMIAVKTSIQHIDVDVLKKIMGRVRELVPVGFNHHTSQQTWQGFDNAPDITIIQQQLDSARKQLGTLGGGNHFIEIQKGDDDHIWLMIHSGSRNFGFKTAKEYHNKAKFLCEKWYSNIPTDELAFFPIESKEGKEYYEAMKYCLEFAFANRQQMMRHLLNATQEFIPTCNMLDEINIHHNYAIFEHHYGQNVIVHRKGATKASIGLRGIIPSSMGSSSYITEGLGNPESFESCSHGAGRKMGRNVAKKSLNLVEEQQKMEGIVHSLRNVADLDEAPGAYKNIDDVMKNQTDLTKILVCLKPLAVIKG